MRGERIEDRFADLDSAPKRYRYRQIQRKKCVICSAPVSEKNHALCEKHRLQRIARLRKYRANLKLSSPR